MADRCVVTRKSFSNKRPQKFRDCLFKVTPILRYSAKIQLEEYTKFEVDDPSILERLKVSHFKIFERN